MAYGGAPESQGAGEVPCPTGLPPDPNAILQRAGWATWCVCVGDSSPLAVGGRQW